MRGIGPGDPVQGSLPNDVELLRQETVIIPAGQAVLLYLKRVPPAAAPAREVTFEYRLLLFRRIRSGRTCGWPT